MKFYIDFEEALSIVLDNVPLTNSEVVPIGKALDRVLREEVISEEDNPPSDLSAMDGYAVNFQDIKKVPVKLDVIGEVRAGRTFDKNFKIGNAVKVFTGSPVKKPFDTVIPIEYVDELRGKVVIKKIFPPGSNIRKKGEDFKRGDVVIEKGTLITPVEMGILASLNRVSVSVSVKPRVGIVTTGDEIVEPGEEKKSEISIRNANAYTLIGFIEKSGGEPIYFGIVKDSKESVRMALTEAFSSCDIVVTSGGISTGDYDFIRDVLPEIGVEVLFYKVKTKPGKPVMFGRINGKFIFSLPGFPVSTVVAFNNFVFPFIRKMMGAKRIFRKKVKGKLLEDYSRRKAERMEFARCKYFFDMKEGIYKVYPMKEQGSGMLSVMSQNVGLMVVPIGVNHISSGNWVDIILIKD